MKIGQVVGYFLSDSELSDPAEYRGSGKSVREVLEKEILNMFMNTALAGSGDDMRGATNILWKTVYEALGWDYQSA